MSPAALYGIIGGSVLVFVLLVAAMTSGKKATPPITQARGQRPPARTTPRFQPTPQPTAATQRQRTYETFVPEPFVDDGKWRGYIQEPIPTNPTTAQAEALFERVQDLSYYGMNLSGADRNAIYRYIVRLCEACTNSPAMDQNWKDNFNAEAGRTRRLITHE